MHMTTPTPTPEQDVESVRAVAKEQAENGAAGLYAVLTFASELIQARGFSESSKVGQMMIGALLQEAVYEIMGTGSDTGGGSTYALLSATSKALLSGE
jgi:hypothetical protein